MVCVNSLVEDKEQNHGKRRLIPLSMWLYQSRFAPESRACFLLPNTKKNGGAVMKKSLFAAILMVLVGGFLASSVTADDTLVRFQGAIGDIPVANVAGAVHPPGALPSVVHQNFRRV